MLYLKQNAQKWKIISSPLLCSLLKGIAEIQHVEILCSLKETRGIVIQAYMRFVLIHLVLCKCNVHETLEKEQQIHLQRLPGEWVTKTAAKNITASGSFLPLPIIIDTHPYFWIDWFPLPNFIFKQMLHFLFFCAPH